MQLRRGTKVTQLTRKVGQVSRTGRVESVRGDTVEVAWDDGRTSFTSRASLVVVPKR